MNSHTNGLSEGQSLFFFNSRGFKSLFGVKVKVLKNKFQIVFANNTYNPPTVDVSSASKEQF